MANLRAAVLVAGLVFSSLGLVPWPSQLPQGDVVMSTDKPCYRPGEPVHIMATGWAGVPSIGDFPHVFWAITNASGDPVFETANMLDAVGSFNGTLNGTWNQTYRRLFGGQPPTGTPVPAGTYVIWFYELAPPNEPPPDWVVPAEIDIGDCGSALVVDAGGPYLTAEGAPAKLAARVEGGASEASVRWDFDGDGAWDTEFSDILEVEHVWSDDFVGDVRVQAMAKADAVEAPRNEAVIRWEQATVYERVSWAQSFVAETDDIASVRLVLSWLGSSPEDRLYTSIREDLDGPDLVKAEIAPADLPGEQVDSWFLENFPQRLAVTPGNVYFLVLRSPGTLTGKHYTAGISEDSYSQGTAHVGTGGGWFEHPSRDLRFGIIGTGFALAEDSAPLEVRNAPPTLRVMQAGRAATFTLRVAGERWHDVRATFYGDGGALAAVFVTRFPGSPDAQAAATRVLDLPLGSQYTATVLYTPDDDPVNGRPNGATPVWILLGTEGREAVRVHHTFNVRHPGTYVWEADLTPYVALLPIAFVAEAVDPGSDDLAFAWDFGDGTAIPGGTYFNDGTGPDPAESLWGTFPFTANDVARHSFPGPGTYAVTVIVTDDDGERAIASLAITVVG